MDTRDEELKGEPKTTEPKKLKFKKEKLYVKKLGNMCKFRVLLSPSYY